jgi:hypothetical protein
LPANFLIDSSGKVAAENLPGNALVPGYFLLNLETGVIALNGAITA